MNNLSVFDKYVEQGLIKKQVSPCGNLVLFDYTEKTQYEKAWDEVTINCRGSVYELSTGKIVARSFPKFFNWSELPEKEQERLSKLTFRAMEKLDGSLGIIYFYNNEWRVNTRGSFVSEQAIKAKSMLKDMKYADKTCTYLSEIIYPENRIVVDYCDQEKLVQLGKYCTATGREFIPTGAFFD